MAIAQKSYKQGIHKVFLSHYGSIHSVGDDIDKVAFGSHQLIELFDIDGIAHIVYNIAFGFISDCWQYVG